LAGGLPKITFMRPPTPLLWPLSAGARR
jgi:hypothetical protein